MSLKLFQTGCAMFCLHYWAPETTLCFHERGYCVRQRKINVLRLIPIHRRFQGDDLTVYLRYDRARSCNLDTI